MGKSYNVVAILVCDVLFYWIYAFIAENILKKIEQFCTQTVLSSNETMTQFASTHTDVCHSLDDNWRQRQTGSGQWGPSGPQ